MSQPLTRAAPALPGSGGHSGPPGGGLTPQPSLGPALSPSTRPLCSKAASPLPALVCTLLGARGQECGHTCPIAVSAPRPPSVRSQPPAPPRALPPWLSLSPARRPGLREPRVGAPGLPRLALRDPAPGSPTAPRPPHLLRQVGQALPQTVQADDRGGVVVPGHRGARVSGHTRAGPCSPPAPPRGAGSSLGVMDSEPEGQAEGGGGGAPGRGRCTVVEAGRWVPPGARRLTEPLGRAQFLEGVSGLALESLWLRPGWGE